MSAARRQLQYATRVEVAAGGLHVVIEADEPMSKVVAAALEVFRATNCDAVTRGVGTVGFHTEMSQHADAPHELPEDLRRRNLKRAP